MPINEILLADPFSPVLAKDADKQDANYEYNKYMGSQYSYYSNPVARLNRQTVEYLNRNLDGTAYVNIFLGLKGLTFKSLVGFDLDYYNGEFFNPFFDLRPNDSRYNLSTNTESKYLLRNNLRNEQSTLFHYSWQNLLNYNNKFGNHEISAMFGYTWENTDYRGFSATKYNMPNNEPNFRVLDAATEGDLTQGSHYQRALISYLGRINYNYGNRYLLTVNIRHDGSSSFARGNRWATFPSFSVGWRIDQEPFFYGWNQNVISSLKIRAGWGQNGNQNIPAFSYANIVSTSNAWFYPFNNGSNIVQAYGITQTGNKNLTWETSEQFNVGMDWTFFSSALNFSADFFIKNTRNMLFPNPLPAMAGYPNDPYTNVGQIQNMGLEILLGYNGNAGDFKYGASVNLTFQKNKLVSTGDGNPVYGNVSKNEEGNPFGMFYGYVYDGIFQTPEEIAAHAGADGSLLQPYAKPGDVRFKNLNNDNVLNDDDRTYIGNPNPKIIFGGNIYLSYKGFDFNLFLQGIAGNDIWVQSKDLMRRTSVTNLLAEAYTDAWRQVGDNTDVPGVSRFDQNDNYRHSSWYVQDGSFCKIKTLQIGYSLPENVLAKTKIFKSLRFYFSAENILTVTKFKFTDPEVSNENAVNLGIYNCNYPNPQTFTFGFNIGL
jgi:TonB-linked SusC/RagA family outer membrane protein